LNAVEGNALRVEMNSPGGDVFTALGIYHMLRAWAAGAGRSLTARVTGLAASAASIIVLAADRREMPASSFAMIHGVSGGAWGSAEDMREAADLVEKVQASLQGIYMARMGASENEVAAMMAGDTWLSAQEALECGFATHVLDAQQLTARFDWTRCATPAHVVSAFTPPDAPQAAKEAPKDTPAQDGGEDAVTHPAPDTQAAAVIALAQAAGLDLRHAQYLALACTTLDEARQRVHQARETITLCNLAGCGDKAAGFIRAHAPLADVRAALLQSLSDADIHTDNAPVSTGGSDAAALNPSAIWKKHLGGAV